MTLPDEEHKVSGFLKLKDSGVAFLGFTELGLGNLGHKDSGR